MQKLHANIYPKHLCTVTLLVIAQLVSAQEPTLVTTEQGLFQGSIDAGVHSFKGMAYAESPTGKRRWLPPLPPTKHSDLRSAKQFGPACLQPAAAPDSHFSSEDCLSINVWTPSLTGTQKPVMVWIHGGGFRIGSGNIPGEVFAQEGVVIASINYRLGPLGFFSHPAIDSQEANFALLDIIQALKWVQENIHHFGGDPDNVTIFGVSAGGAAVNLLMVNDSAKSLFHGAIAQSGNSTGSLLHTQTAAKLALRSAHGHLADDATAISQALISKISSNPQSSEMLRALDGKALVEAPVGFQLPIVDGHSVKEEPGILFARGEQHNIPYMTGGNSFEGTVIALSAITTDEFSRVLGDDLSQVKELYADDFAVSEKQGIERVFGDNRYLVSARLLSESMNQVGAKSWLYYFNYLPQDHRATYPGTPHGVDARILLGGHLAADQPTRQVAARMRSYWLNFARNGNPNGSDDATWPAHSGENDLWLVIDDNDRVSSGVISDKLDFLESLYKKRISQ